MQIRSTLTDEAVLEELGQRIQRHRLGRNVTQARLADEAGVSVPTVQRMEAGASVQLVSLLRVLRALDLLDRAELLVPAPGVRPMELLAHDGKQRRRASPDPDPDDDAGAGAVDWSWGEDP